MKRKRTKSLTFRSGDLNPRFSVIFPPMIGIFMESEEPEIKSKQASKRDRTLKAAPEKLSILFNKLPKQRGWFATAWAWNNVSVSVQNSHSGHLRVKNAWSESTSHGLVIRLFPIFVVSSKVFWKTFFYFFFRFLNNFDFHRKLKSKIQ